MIIAYSDVIGMEVKVNNMDEELKVALRRLEEAEKELKAAEEAVRHFGIEVIIKNTDSWKRKEVSNHEKNN